MVAQPQTSVDLLFTLTNSQKAQEAGIQPAQHRFESFALIEWKCTYEVAMSSDLPICATGFGASKKKARLEAARAALIALRQHPATRHLTTNDPLPSYYRIPPELLEANRRALDYLTSLLDQAHIGYRRVAADQPPDQVANLWIQTLRHQLWLRFHLTVSQTRPPIQLAAICREQHTILFQLDRRDLGLAALNPNYGRGAHLRKTIINHLELVLRQGYDLDPQTGVANPP